MTTEADHNSSTGSDYSLTSSLSPLSQRAPGNSVPSRRRSSRACKTDSADLKLMEECGTDSEEAPSSSYFSSAPVNVFQWSRRKTLFFFLAIIALLVISPRVMPWFTCHGLISQSRDFLSGLVAIPRWYQTGNHHPVSNNMRPVWFQASPCSMDIDTQLLLFPGYDPVRGHILPASPFPKLHQSTSISSGPGMEEGIHGGTDGSVVAYQFIHDAASLSNAFDEQERLLGTSVDGASGCSGKSKSANSRLDALRNVLASSNERKTSEDRVRSVDGSASTMISLRVLWKCFDTYEELQYPPGISSPKQLRKLLTADAKHLLGIDINGDINESDEGMYADFVARYGAYAVVRQNFGCSLTMTKTFIFSSNDKRQMWIAAYAQSRNKQNYDSLSGAVFSDTVDAEGNNIISNNLAQALASIRSVDPLVQTETFFDGVGASDLSSRMELEEATMSDELVFQYAYSAFTKACKQERNLIEKKLLRFGVIPWGVLLNLKRPWHNGPRHSQSLWNIVKEFQIGSAAIRLLAHAMNGALRQSIAK
eukprot:Nk52_evm11s267 gene=Nk52_evmTU11s267